MDKDIQQRKADLMALRQEFDCWITPEAQALDAEAETILQEHSMPVWKKVARVVFGDRDAVMRGIASVAWMGGISGAAYRLEDQKHTD